MKPWYKVVTPREDLRDGRPLDASEFAVHLNHVRDGRAPAVYQDPEEFFDRTYLTKNLRLLASQVVRRLTGVRVETSAVFNLSTQFGGGKTHALTLLYHLAQHGSAAKAWKGVPQILEDANVQAVPIAKTAVFVGTEFDSLAGRGGNGEPERFTPWGEIAHQLGRFEVVKEHDATRTAPAGDVIENLLPREQPTLILLDELINYVSRNRKSGLSTQLYDFLQSLSEVARGRENVVLAVSIPASELEMSADDAADFERYKKLLDRLGKPMIMSAEAETSEIIRRRLFEWAGLPPEATKTAAEYAEWYQTHKELMPSWFPVESAQEAIQNAYPFHPSVLSVFERKWQSLPRFQQTRGVLRLLALWVSNAYQQGFKGAHRDPLITLGTAPLDDSLFRSAVLQQLGEDRLESALTTDVAGTQNAHAVRLDAEAPPDVKKARLHRKIATAVFFESNGGQQKAEATQPEIRLDVADPSLDIGHVEQCLEALTDSCYFLVAERNRYRFSFQANLNKILADRRASVSGPSIAERVRAEIQRVFAGGQGVERVYFPEKSGNVPDRPALTLGVIHPDHPATVAATRPFLNQLITESGSSSRTFKSALLWAVPEDGAALNEEARKLLAWKNIEDDADELKLQDAQRRQLTEHVKRAERDLKEAVWRAYKNVFVLADDNTLRHIDLGLVHSSAANTLVDLVLARLKQEDLVVEGVSPNFLTRYWPPALNEWSTRSVRDAFYASPKFPRLLKPDAVKETISRGLEAGTFAYVGRTAAGAYQPFVYKQSSPVAEIEISEDVFLISKAAAEEHLRNVARPAAVQVCPACGVEVPAWDETGGRCAACGHSRFAPPVIPPVVPPIHPLPPAVTNVPSFRWSGVVPAQKWMNFYTKVLSRFATGDGLKVTISVDVAPSGGVPKGKLDETQAALRELGLPEQLDVKEGI